MNNLALAVLICGVLCMSAASRVESKCAEPCKKDCESSNCKCGNYTDECGCCNCYKCTMEPCYSHEKCDGGKQCILMDANIHADPNLRGQCLG